MPALLVANRSEIARRVFRTAHRLGYRCIAVFTPEDAGEPYVAEADEARPVGSYLDAGQLLEAARGADFLHPGYGFLSEDASFAQAVTGAGIIWVGPSPDAMRKLGNKASAKRLAREHGASVLPGYDGDDQSDAALSAAALQTGFPLLVKPAAGGGGKGMIVVREPGELAPALASARRTARAAFGDGRLMLERYLEAPRHIEVQIFGDASGTVVHVGARDCSLQRRHQKVIEETPPPDVDAGPICEAALRIARAASYTNAGTFEFVWQAGRDGLEPQFGFIECNTRLQVEHAVTEMVYGVDLVEWQLRLARGEPVPQVRSPSGHAIEARIYAEDPDAGFLPQAGPVLCAVWPSGVRVDAGVETGSQVTPSYDPMLAKLVAHAPSREQAIETLAQALRRTVLLGLRSNIDWLTRILDAGDVRGGLVDTTWLQRHPLPGPDAPGEAALRAVAQAAVAAGRRPSADPWDRLGSWRLGGYTEPVVTLLVGEQERTVRAPVVPGAPSAPGREAAAFPIAPHGDHWHVWDACRDWEVRPGIAPRRETGGPRRLEAPLPGTVVAVRVSDATAVQRGDELIVVEAMKMEHSIEAPSDGQVRAVLCAPGDLVSRGQVLVDFEPS